MSAVMPEFEMLRPSTVEEVIAARNASSSARICAGGTDIIVNMRHGLSETGTLIDITAVDELKRTESDADGLHIGAGVTLAEIAELPLITESYPAIAEAAQTIAGPTHRNVATVGGNLCLDTRCLYYNQSHWWRKANNFCLKYKGDICHVAPQGNRCRAAFSGDLAPALMVHGAILEIAGPGGPRRVPLADFYREDGADHLTLAPDEVVTTAHLPSANGVSAYAKVRVRGAIDFPLAGVAVACEKLDASSHRFVVAVTGTNSCPVAIDVPDTLGEDQDPDAFFSNLNKLVQKNVSPQRTSTTAAHYRRLSAATMASRLARQLWSA